MTTSMATHRDAQKLADLGWSVVPAPLKAKVPTGSWKRYQTERLTGDKLKNAFGSPPHNIFVVCGAVSRLCVLDCDDDRAVEFWREHLGSVLDETTCATSGRGRHFYFRLSEGEDPKGRSAAGGESGAWDLRARGGGVIVPPSTHASGSVYTWAPERGPEAIQPAPAGLWPSEVAKTDGKPTSRLSQLLAEPPVEGERNNWLTKVAGYLAKREKHEDAYEALVRALAPVGLEDEEVEKLIKSIWTAEQKKRLLPPTRAELPELISRLVNLPVGFSRELREEAKLWEAEAGVEFRKKVGLRLEQLRVAQEAQSQLSGVSFKPPEVAETLDALLAAPDGGCCTKGCRPAGLRPCLHAPELHRV
jgi:hypothetical protein